MDIDLEKLAFNRASIRPGTKYMQKLDEVVRFFIAQKISEDFTMKNVKMIYSNSGVPGEGEHKIIDYMKT